VITLQRDLWWDMGGGGGEWFVRGRFYSAQGNITLERNYLTPLRGNPAPHRRRELRVDVSQIFARLPGAPSTVDGRVELRLNAAGNPLNGYTWYDGNLIIMAVRSFWRDRPRLWINQCLIHELGHTFTMTSHTDRARNRGLDRVPTSYTGRGHQGQHCHENAPAIAAGARYTAAHTANATCNMFGAAGPNTYQNKLEYCNACERAARLVDLGSGWTGVYDAPNLIWHPFY
jgi:hypothetical protein